MAPAKVTVIELTWRPSLPEGIALREVQPGVTKVELTPGFPTTAQPHRWIGELRISPSSLTYNMPADALEQMVAEAAAHGANTLLRLGPGHGVALRLSSAAPPHPAADQLLSHGLASLQGYRPAPVRTIRLDRLEPIRITARRGTCLAVVMALDAGAEWSPSIRAEGLAESLAVTTGWLATAEPATFVQRSAAVAPRSTSKELTCTLADTVMELRFQDSKLAALASLGRGTAQLMLVEKTVDDAWVKAHSESQLMSYMFPRISDRADAALDRDCVVCAGSMGDCGMYKVKACTPFQDCLQARGNDTRVSYCLGGR